MLQHALEYQRDDASEVSRYTFDKVFDMESSQEQVFAEIGDVALGGAKYGGGAQPVPPRGLALENASDAEEAQREPLVWPAANSATAAAAAVAAAAGTR